MGVAVILTMSVRRIDEDLDVRLVAIDYRHHPSKSYELVNLRRRCPRGTRLRSAADAALVAAQERLWEGVDVLRLAGSPADH